MALLHGNLYEMRKGLFQGELYNQLPHDGIRLEGHYTILFTVPDFKLYVFMHGDYLNLVSYKPIEFEGFMELNETETVYLTEMCKATLEYKSAPYSRGCLASRVYFPYNYELFGKPEYLEQIPE